jgi:DnaJ family protein C protein 28
MKFLKRINQQQRLQNIHEVRAQPEPLSNPSGPGAGVELPPPQKAKDPKAKELARQALVEQKIQAAMAEGAFDNLPGQGKPLNLIKNPYLDTSLELAYGLLQNNNLAPEWIERDKEIRRALEEARRHLHRAWQIHQAEADASQWSAAVARFSERLEKLNRKIDDFNLIVPILSCQRRRLQVAAEIRQVQEGVE